MIKIKLSKEKFEKIIETLKQYNKFMDSEYNEWDEEVDIIKKELKQLLK